MLFGNTPQRSLSWIALLLAAAGLPAAQPAPLETTSCVLAIRNGLVVGLSNRLSGETLVRAAGQEPGLSALHRLNLGDLRVEQAKLLTNSNPAGRSEWAAEWQQPDKVVAGWMRTRNFSRSPPPTSPRGWAAVSRSAAACRNRWSTRAGGARTPLSGAFAAGIILVVVLFFSHLLAALPQPVLAAVVLVAVTGLFKVSTLKQLRHTNRTEYIVAVAALLGVLCSGLLRGVLIGAIISLVLLIRRASRPHVAFLGRIAGTRRFSDHERHPDNELIPGVLIFRPEASLLYFNVEHGYDTIQERVRSEPTPPKLVVLDLSAAAHVDMQSAHTLAGLADELKAMGLRLQVVEARSSVRDRLRGEGVEEKLGGINRFTSVADAVEPFQKQSTT